MKYYAMETEDGATLYFDGMVELLLTSIFLMELRR